MACGMGAIASRITTRVDLSSILVNDDEEVHTQRWGIEEREAADGRAQQGVGRSGAIASRIIKRT